MPKSAEIQDQLNAIDTQIQQGASGSHLDLLEMNKSDLKRQLETTLAEEASQAERNQAQEQAVESITLPYDFNEILSDESYKNESGQPHIITNANNMFIEVVRDFKRQSNADHNAEVDQIKAGYEERLRAADEREAQLQRQNSELQTALEAERQQAMQDAKDHSELLQQIAQLGLDKQDAESKRNAAVTDKEGLELLLSEKQAQIEQLRQDLANAPAPKQSIDITPTDKLAQMVKESAEQKAARGLARWNESNPSLAVAPLEFPVLPTLDNKTVEQSNTAEQVIHPSEVQATDHTNVQADQGNEPIHEVVQPAVESQVTLESLKAELDELKSVHGKRLDRLDKQANLPELTLEQAVA